MASYTHGGGSYAAPLRAQDYGNADQKKGAANGGAEGRHFSRFSAEALASSRKTHHRGKKSSRVGPLRSGPRFRVVAFLVLCIVSITIFGGDYLFSLIRNHTGRNESFYPQDVFENQDTSSLLSFWNRRSKLGTHTKASISYWENVKEDYSEDNEDQNMEVEDEDLSHDNSDVIEANVSVKLKVNSKVSSRMHTQENFSSKGQDLWMHQPSRKTKHRRRSGSPCEIEFLETTEGLQEPATSLRFQNFSLKYVELEHPQGIVDWEPRFAGHQSLAQRNQSFRAEDQTVHCGFVQASGYPQTTGFDISEVDLHYLRTCRIAVSSCIFGSSDSVRSPRNRKLTGSFKKDVCFVMFVDQSTLDIMQEEGKQGDEKGYLGSWKIVLVKNVPYMDARRVGKIPKFLTHRLFPAARYSIWLDSKLRLQNDPVLILEYFLWRGGYEYAISNHYDRHCVWEEVQQNKKLNKYSHIAIDEQFAFYQADGLRRFNASDPRKLLPSNVPEGSFIIRAHTPMSNLFSCLWFNEVDRFTSRDQLSFAYTYMKFVRANPDKHFHFHMFKDCERKTIAKLFRHRKSTSSSFENRIKQEAIQ